MADQSPVPVFPQPPEPVIAADAAPHETGGSDEAAVLRAIRDLVEAAESAGWDVTENREILARGRDAYAKLQFVLG